MALDEMAIGTVPRTLKDELILNCNCTVFCPCVVRLGKHPPTEGHRQTWGGVRLDSGAYGGLDLSGLNTGPMIEIPGIMGRGNWKVALLIDDRSSDQQYDALITLFSGTAKGTTGLIEILARESPGHERQPASYEPEGKSRHITVGRKIQGVVTPVGGSDADKDMVIINTPYWMGPSNDHA